MALRVLLADESSTIKKVFQLALQDYAVDVTTVNIGVDVVNVAAEFRPDIIFIDVLIQKRSGYEVCADLKKNPALRSIPVALMWSGFLDLDQDRFSASQADMELEKPFDVNALRGVVHKLVPKTKTQRLSNFLTFPKDIEEAAGVPPQTQASADTLEANLEVLSDSLGAPAQAPQAQWDMSNFTPITETKTAPPDESKNISDLSAQNSSDDFSQVQLKQPHSPTPVPAKRPDLDSEILSDLPEDRENDWEQKDLSPYQVETPSDELDSFDLDLPDDSYEDDPIVDARSSNEKGTPNHEPVAPSLSEDEFRKIIQEQSRDLIEKIIWQVVPDLAKQMIEKELRKLLSERDLL